MIEQRVENLKDLVCDLPQLLNLRMDSLTTTQHDMATRISLLDMQMSVLKRNVRDMRGSVTPSLHMGCSSSSKVND